MFTDRFISLPVEMISKKSEDLGIDDNEAFEDYIKILPMEITGYRKRFEGEGMEYKGRIIVEFKNRENVIVCLTMEEFENALNAHQK